jgi:hypothetical protein
LAGVYGPGLVSAAVAFHAASCSSSSG